MKIIGAEDFCSLSIDDQALDTVRIRCVYFYDDDPHPTQYCGQAGTEELGALNALLRKTHDLPELIVAQMAG